MAAEYLVTVPPGVYVESVGWVKAGDIFTAPEGYIPSRTFKPLTPDAVAAMAKLKGELLSRAADLKKAAPENPDPAEKKSQVQFAAILEKQAAEIPDAPHVLPVEKPAIRPGVSMSELNDLTGAGDKSHGKQQGKGGRAADR